jgi:hypothetical protein
MYTHARFAMLLFGLLAAALDSHAGVVVTTSGNVAIADISLASAGRTFSAQVTITFDSAQNLNPTELNLTAQLVDPLAPGLLARLPPCLLPALGCATIDANFPILITVEPLNLGEGNLTFRNSYEVEVHTSNLNYIPYSRYRLFKAPINGAFADTTDDVQSGSVRARGRGGTFSQFLIVADTRSSLVVELQKNLALQTRILAATLSSVLHTNLLGLLGNVTSAVLLHNFTLAIANVDQMIQTIQSHAGIDVANTWNSNHLLNNDAGEMLALAQTLRFTLVQLQNGH